MTCWVPIFRAGSLPERIQRRIVSGSLAARLAASGTVIMCCSMPLLDLPAAYWILGAGS